MTVLEAMARAAFEAEPKPAMRAPFAHYPIAIRAALEAAKAAGYVLVPVEPTEAMVAAINDVNLAWYDRPAPVSEFYGAMLAAAPDPTRDA